MVSPSAAIAALHRRSRPSARRPSGARDPRGRDVEDVARRHLGDHQHVAVRPGHDVHERQRVLVLVDLLAGQFARAGSWRRRCWDRRRSVMVGLRDALSPDVARPRPASSRGDRSLVRRSALPERRVLHRAPPEPPPHSRVRARDSRRRRGAARGRRCRGPSRWSPAGSRAPACARPARRPRRASARARSRSRWPGSSRPRNAGRGGPRCSPSCGRRARRRR